MIFAVWTGSMPRLPSAPSIHRAQIRWLGFPTARSSMLNPASLRGTPSSASSACTAASRACKFGRLSAVRICWSAVGVRVVFPVQFGDCTSTWSAASESPAATRLSSCSASACADRLTVRETGVRPTRFRELLNPAVSEATLLPAKEYPSTPSATAMAVACSHKSPREAPENTGSGSTDAAGFGCGVLAFSISNSVRTTSSSVGWIPASLLPGAGSAGRDGSKNMRKMVGQLDGPHKLPQCGGRLRRRTQTGTLVRVGRDLGSWRVRRQCRIDGLRPRGYVAAGFALHHGRLQVPAAEYAWGGLGVDHATVRNAAVVRAQLHSD